MEYTRKIKSINMLWVICLKVDGYSSEFSRQFYEGDNFSQLLASMDGEKTFSKRVLLLKENICSYGSKLFVLEIDDSH